MMRRLIALGLVLGVGGAALWALNTGSTAPSNVIAEALEKEGPEKITEPDPGSKTAMSGSANVAAKPAGHGHGAVVEPDGYRTDDYRSPVPPTLKGAKVVDVEEAWQAWQNKSAVLIDVYPRAPKPPNLPKNTVWREPAHMSIEGAEWLANVGYGVLAPHVESYFKSQLVRLSGGDKTKPMIFFCLRDCWMSWNAGKRAVTWGYTNVMWFSEGTDAWQEAGHKLTRIEVVKDEAPTAPK